MGILNDPLSKRQRDTIARLSPQSRKDSQEKSDEASSDPGNVIFPEEEQQQSFLAAQLEKMASFNFTPFMDFDHPWSIRD